MKTGAALLIAICVLAVPATIFIAARASVQRAELKAQATVAKAKEHTKRAEGRHELLDAVRVLKGHEIQPAR